MLKISSKQKSQRETALVEIDLLITNLRKIVSVLSGNVKLKFVLKVELIKFFTCIKLNLCCAG